MRCCAANPRAALQEEQHSPQNCHRRKPIRRGCLPAQRRCAGMSVLNCFRACITLLSVNDAALRPSPLPALELPPFIQRHWTTGSARCNMKTKTKSLLFIAVTIHVHNECVGGGTAPVSAFTMGPEKPVPAPAELFCSSTLLVAQRR